MKLINTKNRLPNDKEYVLVHLVKDNWIDKDDPLGNRYWCVAKFVRGISEDEREKMKRGEIEDGVSIGLTCPTPPGIWIEHENKRSSVYRAEDEHANNLVPYCWETFGPDSFWGQEVDYWCELPTVEDM